jgi:hypothetical protein
MSYLNFFQYGVTVEWWLKNEMPYSPREMAEKVGSF